MASKRAKAAARAAKRVPVVGTAVVVLPVFTAAQASGLSSATASSGATWSSFLHELVSNYTGIRGNTLDTATLIRTYGPIAGYLLARRFAGRHISRVFRPLGVKF